MISNANSSDGEDDMEAKINGYSDRIYALERKYNDSLSLLPNQHYLSLEKDIQIEPQISSQTQNGMQVINLKSPKMDSYQLNTIQNFHKNNKKGRPSSISLKNPEGNLEKQSYSFSMRDIKLRSNDNTSKSGGFNRKKNQNQFSKKKCHLSVKGQFEPLALIEQNGKSSFSGSSTPSQQFHALNSAQSQKDYLESQLISEKQFQSRQIKGSKEYPHHSIQKPSTHNQVQWSSNSFLEQQNGQFLKGRQSENILQNKSIEKELPGRKSENIMMGKSNQTMMIQGIQATNQAYGILCKSHENLAINESILKGQLLTMKSTEDCTSNKQIEGDIFAKEKTNRGMTNSDQHLLERRSKDFSGIMRPGSQSLLQSIDKRPSSHQMQFEYQSPVEGSRIQSLLKKRSQMQEEFKEEDKLQKIEKIKIKSAINKDFVSLDQRPFEIEFENKRDEQRHNKFKHFNANFLGKQLTLNNKTCLQGMLKPDTSLKYDPKVYEKYKKQLKEQKLQNLIQNDNKNNHQNEYFQKEEDDQQQLSPTEKQKRQEYFGEFDQKNQEKDNNSQTSLCHPPPPPRTAPEGLQRWKYNMNIESKNKDEFKMAPSSLKKEFFLFQLKMQSKEQSRLMSLQDVSQSSNKHGLSNQLSSRRARATSPQKQIVYENEKQYPDLKNKENGSDNIGYDQGNQFNENQLDSSDEEKSRKIPPSFRKSQLQNSVQNNNKEGQSKLPSNINNPKIFEKSLHEILQLIEKTLASRFITEFSLRQILIEAGLSPDQFLNRFSIFLSHVFTSYALSFNKNNENKSKILRHNSLSGTQSLYQIHNKSNQPSKLINQTIQEGILFDLQISSHLQDYLRQEVVDMIKFGSEDKTEFTIHLKQLMNSFLKKRGILTELGVLNAKRLVGQIFTHLSNSYYIELCSEIQEYFYNSVIQDNYHPNISNFSLFNLQGQPIQLSQQQFFFLKQSAKCICERQSINSRIEFQFLERIESLRSLLCQDQFLSSTSINISFPQRRLAAQKLQENDEIVSLYISQELNTLSNALVIVSWLIDICQIISNTKSTSTEFQHSNNSVHNSQHQSEHQSSLIQFYQVISNKFQNTSIEGGLFDYLLQFANNYLFQDHLFLYLDLSRKLDKVKHLHNQSLSPFFMQKSQTKRQNKHVLLFKYLQKIRMNIKQDDVLNQQQSLSHFQPQSLQINSQLFQGKRQSFYSLYQSSSEFPQNNQSTLKNRMIVSPIKTNLQNDNNKSQGSSQKLSPQQKNLSKSFLNTPNSPNKSAMTSKKLSVAQSPIQKIQKHPLSPQKNSSQKKSMKDKKSQEIMEFHGQQNDYDSQIIQIEHTCLQIDDQLMLFKYLMDFSTSFMDIYSMNDILEIINTSKITQQLFEKQLKYTAMYFKQQLQMNEIDISQQLNFFRKYSLLYKN